MIKFFFSQPISWISMALSQFRNFVSIWIFTVCTNLINMYFIICVTGINAVFYYSTNLFITTGLSETSAKYATIGIGSVMVLMTLISIPLMDRSGRRTLHLYGLGGMFIFSIFITISFLVKVKQIYLLIKSNTLHNFFLYLACYIKDL